MTFFKTIISQSTILLYLSEITGLTPIALIGAFAFLILLFILGFYVFIEFKRIRKILMDVNQRLLVLGQKSEEPSPESNFTKISHNRKIDDPNQDKLSHNNKQSDDVAQKTSKTFAAQKELQRQSGEELSDNLLNEETENAANIDTEEFSEPVTRDPELKSAILKLIQAFDMPLSLKHMAEKLSDRYFDGNYHPILIELEQLEKEGHIEGFSKSGKIYFKKKS